MKFIKLFFIGLFFSITFSNGYSLGEKSLISYFNDHPNGVLRCTISEKIYYGACIISYESPNYIIKTVTPHEQKTIHLQNFGTSEKPIFKIISQDGWLSTSKETKLFNQESKILFVREVKSIALYTQYNRGISKYFDNELYSSIFIEFKINSNLKKYETKFTHSCSFVGGVNEFKMEVLGRQDKYPQIDNLREINKIYWVSYHKLCLPKSHNGCYPKSVLFTRIIKDKFPEYPVPIGIKIVSPYLSFHDSTLDMIKWCYHFVLFYVNKEDQKIYILDTFFLDDGVIEFDEWNKKVNGGNNDKTEVNICRIEE